MTHCLLEICCRRLKRCVLLLRVCNANTITYQTTPNHQLISKQCHNLAPCPNAALSSACCRRWQPNEGWNRAAWISKFLSSVGSRSPSLPNADECASAMLREGFIVRYLGVRCKISRGRVRGGRARHVGSLLSAQIWQEEQHSGRKRRWRRNCWGGENAAEASDWHVSLWWASSAWTLVGLTLTSPLVFLPPSLPPSWHINLPFQPPSASPGVPLNLG